MTKLDITIVENTYGVNCVLNSAAHRTVGKQLLTGNPYEDETIQAILKHCGDGIVIHAGAFIGDMLPAISGKGHRVIAFEPGDEFFRCAQITMALNFAVGEHDTTLINKGLSDKLTFNAPLLTKESETKSEGGVSRIVEHPDGVEPWRMEMVELTMIDDVCRSLGEISLIHLDIEGYEEYALRGGLNNIRASKPALIIEVGRDDIELDSDFYKSVIFGELGYKEIDRFCGNRLYVVE